MKKIIVAVFLTLLLLNNLTAVPTDQQVRNAANILEVPYNDLKQFVQSYQNKNVPSGMIKVNAETLCSEYLANQLSANIKYKGKMILLTGKVEAVKSDNKGYYIQLEGAIKDYISYSIDVYFKETEYNRLANVKPGQIINVIGICTGEQAIFSFRVNDAVFSN